MQKLTIRSFQKSDLNRALEILKLNIPKYFAQEELLDFKKYIDNEIDQYFVAEINNRLIGCGGINFEHENKLAKIAWDFVDPEYHKKGIGTQLLQHRIKYIKDEFPEYRIIVRTSQMTFEFYKKQGFKLTEIKKNYWADGFDLYLMEFNK